MVLTKCLNFRPIMSVSWNRREQECVIFFSKIFGVQIKKWQKKKYPAKENREQEYPLSLQNRTTESDEGICRRVWRRQCVPYEGHIVLPNKQKRTPANPACHWLMTTVSGTKNEVDYYISTINKELSTDNGYKRKNCLAKSGKDTFSSSLLHIFRVCWN